MSIPEGATDVFGDDLGFVKLVKWMGDEKDIVNAARVSFHKEVDEFDLQTDGKLLDWLMKKKHGTPFEMGFLSIWHIRAPIFIFREWHRHRVGISINEESGRYVELRPDFYTCANLRTQTGKPGAYTYEPIFNVLMLQACNSVIELGQHDAWARYQWLLNKGIAKEVARQVLPLNIYSEMRYTFNCRSLLNFLALRNHPEAQWEIREYAKVIENLFKENLPSIHQSFELNGRVAP